VWLSGFTWTPTTQEDDPEDHHDRIDFVMAKGKNLVVASAGVVGERADAATIVIDGYPSDHRSPYTTVSFDANSSPKSAAPPIIRLLPALLSFIAVLL
jgi:hypothetical protein